MLKHDIWHKELNYENYTMKSCFHDKKNLYVYKFVYEISEVANKITKLKE